VSKEGRPFLTGKLGRDSAVAAMLTVLGVLVAWPLPDPVPVQGLDASYQAGIVMATQRGLAFGRDVVFTKGPLGYLVVPKLYYPGLALGSALFNLSLGLLALYLVAFVSVQALGLVRGSGLSLLIAGTSVPTLVNIGPAELTALVVGLLSVEWVYQHHDAFTNVLIPILLSLASAFLTLVKFDSGIFAVLFVGSACLLRTANHRSQGAAHYLKGVGRDAGLSLVGFLAGLVFFWMLARQPLSSLVMFLRRSWELVRGYSAAMQLEAATRRWEYVAVLVIAVALLVLGYRAGKARSSFPSRLAVPAFLLLAGLAMFKEGFVRHDGHSRLFFCAMLFSSSVVWRWIDRRTLALLLGLLTVVVVASSNLPLPSLRGAVSLTGPRFAVTSVRDLLRASRRTEMIAAARESLRRQYALSETDLGLLRGHTVHISPWEAQVAWAFPEITWKPAPVFQSYAAFTQPLDDVNAQALASPDAPDFVLRESGALDGRNPSWESPDYVMALLCHYREVSAGPRWQIVQKVPNRCGQSRPLGSSREAFGTPIPIPAAVPGEVVAFRLKDFSRSLASAARSLLFKPDPEYVRFSEGQVFRFLRGHAEGWHLLSVPECLSWSSTFLDRSSHSSFALTSEAAPSGTTGAFTVEFAAFDLQCP
jgi:hypothetical protein